jgi:hypothetical protein
MERDRLAFALPLTALPTSIIMAERPQEAFKEPADPSVNPADSATNKAAGPLPVFALLVAVLAVVVIVVIVMISGAMQ